jgi:hypothetical protein
VDEGSEGFGEFGEFVFEFWEIFVSAFCSQICNIILYPHEVTNFELQKLSHLHLIICTAVINKLLIYFIPNVKAPKGQVRKSNSVIAIKRESQLWQQPMNPNFLVVLNQYH